MTTPAKQRKSNEAKAQNLKPGSNRYKLPDEEYAQLTALKQRLETLGTRVKKSELLRAGLVLLVAMNDAQLKKAVSRAGLIEVGRRSRQASREAAA
ncbi:MAG: hypothetical protein Q8O52_05305 [Sulfuritalea sp.]|nr:hypothetical protein [Sulfuritalea sp.]